MGLAPAFRGRGLGLALLDAAVRRLQALGVDEMIIDWTNLIGFYGSYGGGGIANVPNYYYPAGSGSVALTNSVVAGNTNTNGVNVERQRKIRRRFGKQFKAETVALVGSLGKSVP